MKIKLNETREPTFCLLASFFSFSSPLLHTHLSLSLSFSLSSSASWISYPSSVHNRLKRGPAPSHPSKGSFPANPVPGSDGPAQEVAGLGNTHRGVSRGKGMARASTNIHLLGSSVPGPHQNVIHGLCPAETVCTW